MKILTSIFVIAGFLLSGLLVTSIVAAVSGHAEYHYLIGTGLLCDLAEDACPVVSMAENGDTITITGEGDFSIHEKSATGGGTFVHKDAEGNVLGEGTWEAVKLISFQAFGSGSAQGLPEELEGGKMLMMVSLTPEGSSESFDAVLETGCELGKVPGGATEGIKLNVKDLINFNKEVSGFTVFIRTA